MPQLIAMEPPTQWDPYPVLVPHHIPVTVQRGLVGNKMLCDVALGQAGCIGSRSGISDECVLCKPFPVTQLS